MPQGRSVGETAWNPVLGKDFSSSEGGKGEEVRGPAAAVLGRLWAAV